MKIYEDKVGTDHVDTALTFQNIGNVYYEIGENDKAKMYYLKVREIYEDKFGMDHVNTAKSYNNIGNVYFREE